MFGKKVKEQNKMSLVDGMHHINGQMFLWKQTEADLGEGLWGLQPSYKF